MDKLFINLEFGCFCKFLYYKLYFCFFEKKKNIFKNCFYSLLEINGMWGRQVLGFRYDFQDILRNYLID